MSALASIALAGFLHAEPPLVDSTAFSADKSRQVVPTDLLADQLDIQLQALDGMELTFTVEHHVAEGNADPDPSAIEGGEYYFARDRWETYYWSGLFNWSKVCEHVPPGEAFDDLRFLLDNSETHTWDGRSFRSDYNLSGDRTTEITGRVPVRHRKNHFPSWQGWDVLQLERELTYSQLLRTAVVTGPTLRSDDRTEWRCSVDSPDGDMILPNWQIKLVGEWHHGDVRLVSAELNVFAADVNLYALGDQADVPKQLRATARVSFEPNPPDCDAPIPTRATFTAQHWYPDGGFQDMWGKSEIRLEQWLRRDPAAVFKERPVPDAASVIDRRYEIGYRIGGTRLNVDGRVFRTDVPMEGIVGDELERWISNGKFEDTIEQTRSDQHVTRKDDS